MGTLFIGIVTTSGCDRSRAAVAQPGDQPHEDANITIPNSSNISYEVTMK